MLKGNLRYERGKGNYKPNVTVLADRRGEEIVMLLQGGENRSDERKGAKEKERKKRITEKKYQERDSDKENENENEKKE